jgi:DNA-binding NtrC family response regulator
VDVRILAATHRDLKAMVSEGRFREDLFYRLAVAQIQLPALRDRPEDIAPLIAHFLEQNEVGPRSIEPEALVLLERQPWPGNVRELSNFVMNLLLFDREGGHISLELVRRILGPEAGHGDDGGVAVTEASSGEFLKARLEAFERAQVRQALDDAGGNKSEAARRLGVGVRTLYKMLSRLGLA